MLFRSYVVFTSAELQDIMKGITGGIVDVVQFVDRSEIDPIYFRSSYYLAPEKTGLKAYRILMEGLEAKGMVGISKVAIREREYLGTIRAEEGVLANMIIDNLAGTFDPSAWHDESREAVEAAAAKKIEGEEIVAPDVPEATGVVDLMDALRASVEATKEKKAG